MDLGLNLELNDVVGTVIAEIQVCTHVNSEQSKFPLLEYFLIYLYENLWSASLLVHLHYSHVTLNE